MRGTAIRILLVVSAVALVAGCAGQSPPVVAGPATPAEVPREWPLPADPSAAAAKAGLPMLGREMLDVHYHAHVDVIVRGVAITVPAGIGIDTVRGAITALHTHDETGIVHIESGEDIPFTLGQLFAEWGQPLAAGQVGPVVAQPGEQVRVYRNGTVVTGDPAALRFKAHDQIVVWLGPASQQPKVAASYTFPTGL